MPSKMAENITQNLVARRMLLDTDQAKFMHYDVTKGIVNVLSPVSWFQYYYLQVVIPFILLPNRDYSLTYQFVWDVVMEYKCQGAPFGNNIKL